VTGGAGFIGSNLADALAAAGHDVLVYDSLLRPGVERNLAWLQSRHGKRIAHWRADVRDADALGRAAREAKAVFHFAAQVAVTTSIVDPREDHDVNVRATFELLEALRVKRDGTPIIFASTNKVFGDLGDVEMRRAGDRWEPADAKLRTRGVGEDRSLDFHTPYGCSKGAADQYVLDYARSFGVPTCVLRMSCIYGQRQMGTEDQGWVAHFLIRALMGQPITLYGDGAQVRDILDVRDAVAAYLAAWARIGSVSGRAFNLGGGPANAVSLKQLLAHIEAVTGRPVAAEFAPWRPGDQKWFVADTARAEAELGLGAKVPWREGVAALAVWLAAERGLPSPSHASGAGRALSRTRERAPEPQAKAGEGAPLPAREPAE
jgi:CDP-paratose 2-epimerase